MSRCTFERPPPTVASVLLTGAPLPEGSPDLSGLVIGGLAALARAATLFNVWMVEIGGALAPPTWARPVAGRHRGPRRLHA